MPKFEVQIDEKRCKGCTICVQVCKPGCLEVTESFNQAGYFYPAMKEGAKCNGCGSCVMLCPDFAITVYEIVEEAAG